MKLVVIAILALLVGGSWLKFSKSGKEVEALEAEIKTLYDSGDREEKVPALKNELNGLEGARVFSGILLAFLTAGLVGILFVVYLLPFLGDRLSESLYGSNEEVEIDAFHRARVKSAQGEWEDAIEAFREAGEEEPENRLPWVEISKIYRERLEDTAAALGVLREGIESREWPEDDAAFLMFRMADIYEEDLNDREAAATILRQVTMQLPETRHSANARNKLLEWGMA